MEQPGVYILQSAKNSRYYLGSTDNVINRLSQHNHGLVTATRYWRPFTLKRFISCSSLREAKIAEYKLKQYKRRDILEKVIQDGQFPWHCGKNTRD